MQSDLSLVNMMANLTSLYVWVLLAALWRVSAGRHLLGPSITDSTDSTDTSGRCAALSLDLLHNIRGLLKDEALFVGVRCCHLQAEVNTKTDTVSACAPFQLQNSSCSGPLNNHTSFNERKCLGNIVTDLAHYSIVLQSYLKTSLRLNPQQDRATLTPTINMIEGLIKHCSRNNIPVENIQEEYFSGKGDAQSFNNRKRLCEVTHGFYIRAITINRAIGYISSGDHRRHATASSGTN